MRPDTAPPDVTNDYTRNLDHPVYSSYDTSNKHYHGYTTTHIDNIGPQDLPTTHAYPLSRPSSPTPSTTSTTASSFTSSPPYPYSPTLQTLIHRTQRTHSLILSYPRDAPTGHRWTTPDVTFIAHAGRHLHGDARALRLLRREWEATRRRDKVVLDRIQRMAGKLGRYCERLGGLVGALEWETVGRVVDRGGVVWDERVGGLVRVPEGEEGNAEWKRRVGEGGEHGGGLEDGEVVVDGRTERYWRDMREREEGYVESVTRRWRSRSPSPSPAPVPKRLPLRSRGRVRQPRRRYADRARKADRKREGDSSMKRE